MKATHLEIKLAGAWLKVIPVKEVPCELLEEDLHEKGIKTRYVEVTTKRKIKEVKR